MVNGPQLCFVWIFGKIGLKRGFLVQNAPGARRNDVNDAESAFFELTQQGRQHLGGLGLGVVEQHDAMVDLLDSAEDEPQFLVGDIGSIAGPDIGAEHDDAAFVQAVEQRLGRGKARKPEERRHRRGAALAEHGVFVFLDAVIDFRFRLGQGHMVEQRMRIRVMADRVTFGQRPPRQRRRCLGILAQKKKRGADALSLERVRAPWAWCRAKGRRREVSTSSLRRSGSVAGKCLRPTRGVVLASTSMTRSVPSAWLLPGHGAARAAKERWPRRALR